MVDVRTNLLKYRHVLSEKDYQKEQNFLRLSISAMIIVVLVVIALSAWSYVLTGRLSKIEQSLTTTSKDLQNYSQASAQQIYLKSRLQLVTNFLENRSLTRESLQKILSTEFPGTHISSLDFKDETTLSVVYSMRDVASLDKLISYYSMDTSYYTQVVSNGLSRVRDGSYTLSLLLTLPKGVD